MSAILTYFSHIFYHAVFFLFMARNLLSEITRSFSAFSLTIADLWCCSRYIKRWLRIEHRRIHIERVKRSILFHCHVGNKFNSACSFLAVNLIETIELFFVVKAFAVISSQLETFFRTCCCCHAVAEVTPKEIAPTCTTSYSETRRHYDINRTNFLRLSPPRMQYLLSLLELQIVCGTRITNVFSVGSWGWNQPSQFHSRKQKVKHSTWSADVQKKELRIERRFNLYEYGTVLWHSYRSPGGIHYYNIVYSPRASLKCTAAKYGTVHLEEEILWTEISWTLGVELVISTTLRGERCRAPSYIFNMLFLFSENARSSYSPSFWLVAYGAAIFSVAFELLNCVWSILCELATFWWNCDNQWAQSHRISAPSRNQTVRWSKQ